MDKEELKNKIVEANKKYRSGNPIMSDTEYDNLLEDYQKMVSNDEYTSFRNTLNEGMIEYGKKIKHKYFGSVTVMTIEGAIIDVDFEQVGRKKIGYEFCMKNNMLEFI